VLPTLGRDGYAGSIYWSFLKAAHSLSQRLSTLTDTFRRPGPSLGTFIIAILAVALVSWGLVHWWKPSAINLRRRRGSGMTKEPTPSGTVHSCRQRKRWSNQSLATPSLSWRMPAR
jgi:hypothetical protein